MVLKTTRASGLVSRTSMLLTLLLLPACSNEKPVAKSGNASDPATKKQSPSDLALAPSNAAPLGNRERTSENAAAPPVDSASATPQAVSNGDMTKSQQPAAGQAFVPRNMGITAPNVNDLPEDPPLGDETQEALEKITGSLRDTASSSPSELVLQLSELDGAMRDLTVASSGQIIEPEQSLQIGKQLGELKLSAGQKLANSPESTPEQRRAGVIAQLIALSHLSGLGDVKAAQQLESLAGDLSKHSDPKISHESSLILVGFTLQALQNGIEKDAGIVAEQMQFILQEPAFRGFPEFLVGRRSVQVLDSMGYKEEANQVRKLLASAYATHPDPKLRNEAWAFETQGSQARENYNTACSLLGTPNASIELLLGAARALYDEFPSPQTLEELASSMTKIERGGFIDVSNQIAEIIRPKLDDWESSDATIRPRTWLEAHDRRVAMLNQSFAPSSLVRIGGDKIDIQEFKGRTLFIDFWASDCLPCLQELPKLREIHARFSSQDFAILGISVDTAPDEATAFVQQQRIPWDVARFSDAAGLDSAFAVTNGIDAIPFNVLLNAEGVVERIHLTTGELESLLSEKNAPGESLIP